MSSIFGWFFDMIICIVWDKVTSFECDKLFSFGYVKFSFDPDIFFCKLSSFRYVKLCSNPDMKKLLRVSPLSTESSDCCVNHHHHLDQ